VTDESPTDGAKLTPEEQNALTDYRFTLVSNALKTLADATTSAVERHKALVERVGVSENAANKKFDFLIEQQAQLTTNVDSLRAKVDRTADSVTSLLAIAEIQSGEIRELGESVRGLGESVRTISQEQRLSRENLNALINTVERFISEGRKGA
jgi:hypothetical protein